MTTGAHSLRLDRLTVLLDQAVELARSGPHRPFVVYASILATANALFSALTVAPSIATLAGGEAASAFASCGLIALLFTMMPVLLVVSAFVYGGFATLATRRTLGGDASFDASLRDLVNGRMLGTLLLAGIAIAIGSVIALPFFFLVVPFFIVPGLLAFTVPVALCESKYGLDALARSARLAWGKPSVALGSRALPRTWAAFLVSITISTTITLIIQLPYQLVVQALTFRQVLGGGAVELMAPLLWLQVPVSALVSFVGSWAIYYTFHALALLYREARERFEGTELEAAIAALERRATGTGDAS